MSYNKEVLKKCIQCQYEEDVVGNGLLLDLHNIDDFEKFKNVIHKFPNILQKEKIGIFTIIYFNTRHENSDKYLDYIMNECNYSFNYDDVYNLVCRFNDYHEDFVNITNKYRGKIDFNLKNDKNIPAYCYIDLMIDNILNSGVIDFLLPDEIFEQLRILKNNGVDFNKKIEFIHDNEIFVYEDFSEWYTMLFFKEKSNKTKEMKEKLQNVIMENIN